MDVMIPCGGEETTFDANGKKKEGEFSVPCSTTPGDAHALAALIDDFEDPYWCPTDSCGIPGKCRKGVNGSSGTSFSLFSQS